MAQKVQHTSKQKAQDSQTAKRINEGPVVGLLAENPDSVLNVLRYYFIDRIIEIYPQLSKDAIAKKVYFSKPSLDSFGDYSTNIALVLSGLVSEDPKKIARHLVDRIDEDIRAKNTNEVYHILGKDIMLSSLLERAELAGPGFINVWLSPLYLSTWLSTVLTKRDTDRIIQSITDLSPLTLSDRKIMIEFAHPNTHKEFHIGHLRNISIGESLVRILEAAGATLFRANYEGDVGMHVAKAVWGVYEKLKDKSENLKINESTVDKQKLEEISLLSPAAKAKFLGEAYALGSKMADENEDTKKQIIALNKKIYQDPKKVELWEETRGWSLEYFDSIYKRLGTRFDRLFFESEVEAVGRQLVIDNIKTGIFVKDADGSIYFPGENYGLNNCVFVTKEDYATYEGKEVGLEDLEYQTFPFDLEVHVVANEQINFFQIAFEAVAQVFPYQRGRQYHLAYGMVQLKGAKLSSRTGQVITADSLIDDAKEKIKDIMKVSVQEPKLTASEIEEIAEAVAVGAVKYSMLRVNPLVDISFDLEESIAFDGDSGPYLMYTYARCKSVLRKSEIRNSKSEIDLNIYNVYQSISDEEKDVVRTLHHFPEVVVEAGKALSPNLVASYLFTLAQKYNLFYNKHSILGIKKNESSAETPPELISFRLALTQATANMMKAGLNLLGINTVERM